MRKIKILITFFLLQDMALAQIDSQLRVDLSKSIKAIKHSRRPKNKEHNHDLTTGTTEQTSPHLRLQSKI